MSTHTEIERKVLTGERALFMSRDLNVSDCIFADGESPLKESARINLSGCMFRWKYPLWYCQDIKAENCVWFDMARAGVWYTKNIVVSDCEIEAPKNFRRCDNLTLRRVSFSNAAETLWSCQGVTIEDVTAKGDYFAMNSQDMNVSGLKLFGNYSFDGVKNATVTDSKLLSKDAFWNCENVTVKDCFIAGEYLGWNAENLTFENCTIESLQGLCYISNLKMINCKLINTTLAFEYSSVDAEITGGIDSVINPTSGRIKADYIDELILEKDKIDPDKTKIIVSNREN